MKQRTLKPSGKYQQVIQYDPRSIKDTWILEDGTIIRPGELIKAKGVTMRVLKISDKGLLIQPQKQDS